MKKNIKKTLAIIISAVTMISCTGFTVSAAGKPEKPIDPALVIDENIGNTYSALSKFVSDNELTGYVALNSEKLVEVVCYTAGQLDRVKEFAAENGLDEALIVYTVDENMDLSVTDGGEVRLATNEELEQLIDVREKLWQFVNDNGYTDERTYVSLMWYRQSVQLYVKDQQVYDSAVNYVEENGIGMTDVVLSPEYNFEIPMGGGKEGEINGIVVGEYFAIKNFMSENSYLSNIYLTHPSEYVTAVDVYVKDNETADALNKYMDENYFWKDVVNITVTDDLTPWSDGSVKNKSFVVIDGDVNDDGVVAVSDVVMLQKNLLGDSELNERQICSSDMLKDDNLDVFDLCRLRREVIEFY